jgi:hypothetical protein
MEFGAERSVKRNMGEHQFEQLRSDGMSIHLDELIQYAIKMHAPLKAIRIPEESDHKSARNRSAIRHQS